MTSPEIPLGEILWAFLFVLYFWCTRNFELYVIFEEVPAVLGKHTIAQKYEIINTAMYSFCGTGAATFLKVSPLQKKEKVTKEYFLETEMGLKYKGKTGFFDQGIS